jgi:hypothetical protein
MPRVSKSSPRPIRPSAKTQSNRALLLWPIATVKADGKRLYIYFHVCYPHNNMTLALRLLPVNRLSGKISRSAFKKIRTRGLKHVFVRIEFGAEWAPQAPTFIQSVTELSKATVSSDFKQEALLFRVCAFRCHPDFAFGRPIRKL